MKRNFSLLSRGIAVGMIDRKERDDGRRGKAVVTREHLDLRLGELATRLEAKIAELRSETLKWMFGAVGLQTLAILGGVAALLRLFGR